MINDTNKFKVGDLVEWIQKRYDPSTGLITLRPLGTAKITKVNKKTAWVQWPPEVGSHQNIYLHELELAE